MTAKFRTAEERENAPTISKGLIFGLPGAGKTHLLHTLPKETTVFLNLDKGDLTVKNSGVKYEFIIESWEDLRDFAVFFGGAIPGLTDSKDYATEDYTPYTQAHRDIVIKKFIKVYGEDLVKELMTNVKAVFLDSLSEGANFCEVYVKKNKKTITNGIEDGFKFWGLVKKEQEGLLRRFQGQKKIDIWYVAQIGDRVNQKTKETEYFIDVAGSFKRTVLQIPDHIFYIKESFTKEGVSYRYLQTNGSLEILNGLVLKSRGDTGSLEAKELPDLSYLSEKIKEGKKIKKEKETK